MNYGLGLTAHPNHNLMLHWPCVGARYYSQRHSPFIFNFAPHTSVSVSASADCWLLYMCNIILYLLTLPCITALGYLKLDSLKQRRMAADEKFFSHIFQRLLLPARETLLLTRLQHAKTYPILVTRTKRFCSFINYALTNCL